jgi:hypothetical protein
MRRALHVARRRDQRTIAVVAIMSDRDCGSPTGNTWGFSTGFAPCAATTAMSSGDSMFGEVTPAARVAAFGTPVRPIPPARCATTVAVGSGAVVGAVQLASSTGRPR